jgi:hypothetical protein
MTNLQPLEKKNRGLNMYVKKHYGFGQTGGPRPST